MQEPLQKILHSVTESTALKHEIDRVLPQLRVTIRASDKHWRMHDEQLSRLQEQLGAQFEAVRPFLAQLAAELQQSVERIGSREKHLNEQLHPLLQDFRLARNALAELSERYRQVICGFEGLWLVSSEKLNNMDLLFNNMNMLFTSMNMLCNCTDKKNMLFN